MTATRIPVAVLGATGAVGQAFVRHLAGHPCFEITEVAASERSAGKRYVDAARWLEGTLPAEVGALTVKACDPADITAPIVFSALDSAVAGEVEAQFARAGRLVLSNAKNFRMEDDVPLVIPEVNGDHLSLLAYQQRSRNWSGGIVTNANCAVTVVASVLAPLHERFTVSRLVAVTMQAISGAGYPGVASLDILGNVIPFIGDEEPKIERELSKLLGSVHGGLLSPASIAVSAHANRVAVEHGHTVCMSIGFENAPSVQEAIDSLREWRGYAPVAGLPSAPAPPIAIWKDADRPQPRRDVMLGGGMTISVGRVREDSVLDLRLVALAHNVVRGAAGGSVLNAELLVANGAIDRTTGVLRTEALTAPAQAKQ